MPAYPEAYASGQERVCVAMGYLLNADGHTSDHALLKSWRSGNEPGCDSRFWGAFAGAASQALSRWKFAPPPAGSRVAQAGLCRTDFRVRADGGDGRAGASRDPDLVVHLVELRYNGRAGRMMSRGIFSRLDIDPGVEERLRQQKLLQREDLNQSRMSQAIKDLRQKPPEQPPPSSSGN